MATNHYRLLHHVPIRFTQLTAADRVTIDIAPPACPQTNDRAEPIPSEVHNTITTGAKTRKVRNNALNVTPSCGTILPTR